MKQAQRLEILLFVDDWYRCLSRQLQEIDSVCSANSNTTLQVVAIVVKAVDTFWQLNQLSRRLITQQTDSTSTFKLQKSLSTVFVDERNP